MFTCSHYEYSVPCLFGTICMFVCVLRSCCCMQKPPGLNKVNIILEFLLCCWLFSNKLYCWARNHGWLFLNCFVTGEQTVCLPRVRSVNNFGERFHSHGTGVSENGFRCLQAVWKKSVSLPITSLSSFAKNNKKHMSWPMLKKVLGTQCSGWILSRLIRITRH